MVHGLQRAFAKWQGLDDPEQRAWSCPAARAACQAQANEANALIARSLELETRAEAAMHARRNAAGLALSALQTATDARSAYAPMPTAALAGLQGRGAA